MVQFAPFLGTSGGGGCHCLPPVPPLCVPVIQSFVLINLYSGQMDPASKVFDFLYLGSEWNASNLEVSSFHRSS